MICGSWHSISQGCMLTKSYTEPWICNYILMDVRKHLKIGMLVWCDCEFYLAWLSQLLYSYESFLAFIMPPPAILVTPDHLFVCLLTLFCYAAYFYLVERFWRNLPQVFIMPLGKIEIVVRAGGQRSRSLALCFIVIPSLFDGIQWNSCSVSIHCVSKKFPHLHSL